jgi:SAM-dependent methyltransferase
MEERLKILDVQETWRLQRSVLSDFVKGHFSGHEGKLSFLEAGCGKAWNLDLEELDYVLTGVDISKEALDIRLNQQRDLDEAILGNLESVKLEVSRYDLIYCSYVLEHVRQAEDVLDNFFRWLKPGGLLVLLIPDRDTFRCFVSRATPHWFHIFLYRYVMRRPHAGEPGHAPFRAYYHEIVSRRGIHDYCRRHGHSIHIEYGKKDSFTSKPGNLVSLPIVLVGKLIQLLSFGKITTRHCDLIYTIENKARAQ